MYVDRLQGGAGLCLPQALRIPPQGGARTISSDHHARRIRAQSHGITGPGPLYDVGTMAIGVGAAPQSRSSSRTSSALSWEAKVPSSSITESNSAALRLLSSMTFCSIVPWAISR